MELLVTQVFDTKEYQTLDAVNLLDETNYPGNILLSGSQ